MEIKDKVVRLVTLGLILLFGWVLYWGVIVPKRQGVKSLRQALGNMEFQINKILGEEVALRGGAMQAEQLEKELASLVVKIPSERDLPKIIDQLLNQVGAGLKINYSLVEPKEIKAEGKSRRIPIELRLKTTYPNFLTYLTQLDKLRAANRIDLLELRRPADKPEELDVHLILSVFVMPEGEEQRTEDFAKELIPKTTGLSPFKPARNIPASNGAEGLKPTGERGLEPVTATTAPKEVLPTLQGIMKGDFKAAIIDNEVLYVDDVMGGWRVVRITDHSVVMKKGGRNLTLEMK
jgi:Tfp pilus assembly protein PilO